MSQKWLEEDIKYLSDNYNNKTLKEIGIIINRSEDAISLKLRRLGLRKQKYNFDTQFFKIIDTEEKAYWLGFMYADGYVAYSEKNRSYEASIELKAFDNEHLSKFNKSLKGNVPVTYRERERWGKLHKICSIRFYSKELVFDLMDHGCVLNKTKIIQMPDIKNPLIKHFIRGFFDGDGSVYKRKDRNGLYANFTSASYDFLVEIRKFLYELGINSQLVKAKKDEDIYQLRISGKKFTMIFFKHIYEGSTIFLNRKYSLFDIENRLAS